MRAREWGERLGAAATHRFADVASEGLRQVGHLADASWGEHPRHQRVQLLLVAAAREAWLMQETGHVYTVVLVVGGDVAQLRGAT